mmetsp:Transcript_12324/g.29864  ORF Transcript_12324/g.29864 Transcript_12324/m.29864 type:complete len:425 (-) Transcript_12324:1788-3062(-)
MGDDHRRSTGVTVTQQPVERGLDQLLALVVQRRRGLVQQQDARLSDDGASDGDALLLSAANQPAADPNLRVIPPLHLTHKLVSVGHLGRLDYLLARGRPPLASGDVIMHAAAEQSRLLLDDANLAPEPHHVQVSQVDAIQQHRAGRGVLAAHQDLTQLQLCGIGCRRDAAASRLSSPSQPDYWVVEALDELHCSGLSAARLSDERHGVTRVDHKVETPQDGGFSLRVGEPDAAELDAAAKVVSGDDGALAARSGLLLGLGHRAHLGALNIHGSWGAVHEGSRVDGGDAIDEREYARRRRLRHHGVAGKRRRLPRACRTESQRPKTLHEVVEADLPAGNEGGPPPERKRVEEHGHQLGPPKGSGGGDAPVALLFGRDPQERVVHVEHAALQAEGFHLANHRRGFADVSRTPPQRPTHRGLSGGQI